jgi:hypothetical protein
MVLFTIFLVSCANEQSKNVDVTSTPIKIVANKSNAIAMITDTDIENAIRVTKDMK